MTAKESGSISGHQGEGIDPRLNSTNIQPIKLLSSVDHVTSTTVKSALCTSTTVTSQSDGISVSIFTLNFQTNVLQLNSKTDLIFFFNSALEIHFQTDDTDIFL